MVKKLNGIQIRKNEPYTVLVDDNTIKVKEIMEKHKIKSVLVTNGENQLKGFIVI